ncbi:MAG: 2-C-methyl-D-erythritol 4-phosphate cytidylyltransferase [Candidatus Cryptobacteroides sp.]
MFDNNYVIIMAAGSGIRMGYKMPKQFLTISGKTILQITIEKFISACPGIKIITVLPDEYMDYWKQYCYKHEFLYPQILVKGGITRFHSVKNALAKVPDGTIVAIHDGVRPLVSERLISMMFDKMRTGIQALIPVLQSVDTLRVLTQTENGWETVPERTVDRNEIFAVQTPQIFQSSAIKEAYNQAFDTSFTDDSSVADKKNIPLSYILGERYNIKLTNKEDLVFAETLLSGSIRI